MCYCGKCKNNFDCNPCEEPIGTHSLFTDCSQHKGMMIIPRYEVLKYRLHNLLIETEDADLLDEFEKIVKEKGRDSLASDIEFEIGKWTKEVEPEEDLYDLIDRMINPKKNGIRGQD